VGAHGVGIEEPAPVGHGTAADNARRFEDLVDVLPPFARRFRGDALCWSLTRMI
jgi:hypothetical protein